MNGNCGSQNNVYIGARYVPKIVGEWSADIAYEPLTVVLYQGTSYTSITYVPKGIIPSETTQQYWALTGNYNAQVEQYRKEVENYKNEVELIKTLISYSFDNIEQMKQSEILKNGDYVSTLGYINLNDNGSAIYKITNIVDEDNFQVILNNGLYATLIPDKEINLTQICDNNIVEGSIVEKMFNIAIKLGLIINLNKNITVNPTLRSDNKNVCIDIQLGSSVNKIIVNQTKAIVFNLNENDIGLRYHGIGSIFNNLYLTTSGNNGVLLSLSPINDNDSLPCTYNEFTNINLYGGHYSLQAMGSVYYNRFIGGYIQNSDNGIWLGAIPSNPKTGTNRNLFEGITFRLQTNNSFEIYYGDTNKLINSDFEGCKNCIVIGNSTIGTSKNTLNIINNITFEAITGVKIYEHGVNNTYINVQCNSQEIVFVTPPMFLSCLNALFNGQLKSLNGGSITVNNEKYQTAGNYSSTLNTLDGINTFTDYYLNDGVYVKTYANDNKQSIVKNDDNIKTLTVNKFKAKRMGTLIFVELDVNISLTNINVTSFKLQSSVEWWKGSSFINGVLYQWDAPTYQSLLEDAIIINLNNKELIVNAPKNGVNQNFSQENMNLKISGHFFADSINA